MNELRIPSSSLPPTTPRVDANLAAARGRPEEASSGFVERVAQVLAEADQSQKTAEHEVRELAHGSGRTTETMLALSRAELSLQFVVAFRNRAIQAYQEIMRLQV